LRMRTADLYAKDADGAQRAAELLREAQKIPTISAGQDIYATNRLVDLLTGPLGEPKRALVELRRLVERYPTSGAAAHARAAIARLRNQRELKADERRAAVAGERRNGTNGVRRDRQGERPDLIRRHGGDLCRSCDGGREIGGPRLSVHVRRIGNRLQRSAAADD